MSSFTFPNGHHQATLDATSPPVVLGRCCPITGEPLRPGDQVVICDFRPDSDPIHLEGWTTCGTCPHCGVSTGRLPAYVPPIWQPLPPPPMPPPHPDRRPLALTGPLAALLLLGALAIAVAAVVFFLRTRPVEEPIAGVALATAEAATADAATVTAAGNLPAAATDTPVAPTSLPVVLPSPTAALAPTPVPPPSPTTSVATPDPPPTAIRSSSIITLLLVNPANGRVLRALQAGDTVDLSEVGRNHLTVLAQVDDPAVESITFLLDGQPFCSHGNCIENVAPYYMGGDQNGDAYDDWDWSQMLGNHTLTAIACTGDNATGDCSTGAEVNLVIRR